MERHFFCIEIGYASQLQRVFQTLFRLNVSLLFESGNNQPSRLEDGQLGQERAYWLAWSQISGVGPVLLRRLQQHFGTLAAAWDAKPAQLKEVEGFGLFNDTSIMRIDNILISLNVIATK